MHNYLTKQWDCMLVSNYLNRPVRGKDEVEERKLYREAFLNNQLITAEDEFLSDESDVCGENIADNQSASQ